MSRIMTVFAIRSRTPGYKLLTSNAQTFGKNIFFLNKDDNIRVSKDAIKKSGNQIQKFKLANYFIL